MMRLATLRHALILQQARDRARIVCISVHYTRVTIIGQVLRDSAQVWGVGEVLLQLLSIFWIY